MTKRLEDWKKERLATLKMVYPANETTMVPISDVDYLLTSQLSIIAEEVLALDKFVCVCEGEDKKCEYNKGLQKALDDVLNIIKGK